LFHSTLWTEKRAASLLGRKTCAQSHHTSNSIWAGSHWEVLYGFHIFARNLVEVFFKFYEKLLDLPKMKDLACFGKMFYGFKKWSWLKRIFNR
jgi:hypothetical protein